MFVKVNNCNNIGIFEESKDTFIKDNHLFMRFWCGEKEVEPEDLGEIIKKSETVEPLCDCFYVQVEDWSFSPSKLFDNLEKSLNELSIFRKFCHVRKNSKAKVILRGYIITKNDLICVAESKDDNEKLELL